MTIKSYEPRTGSYRETDLRESTPAEVAEICRQAAAAAPAFRSLTRADRAELLLAMAAELESSREQIVATADRETALGEPRLNGELTRTCYQLRMFAEVVTEGSFLESTIDHAGPTDMGPSPDLRRVLTPLGPVGVFGASNFPLAFSVPGGDTAAAIAAGCPVVIKAHSAHPETSQLTFDCLVRAASASGAPEGILGLVFGRAAGTALVQDPHITAVGFTGSEAGGRALYNLAASRPEPIPFYGELGSVNPLAVLPAAARARTAEIAAGYVASITLGGGQFCTKPGIMFVPSAQAEEFRTALSAELSPVSSPWLLSQSIRDAFTSGVEALVAHEGVELLGGGVRESTADFAVTPSLFWAKAGDVTVSDDVLFEECFGPAGIIIEYGTNDELIALLTRLRGTLTATIHAEEDEDGDLAREVLDILATKAGRILWNGFPTGVMVAWAMTHGGPYPSSTSAGHTSVGATSIRRFLRPVSYQAVPASLLPAELRDDYGTSIPRRIGGVLQV